MATYLAKTLTHHVYFVMAYKYIISAREFKWFYLPSKMLANSA